MRTRPGASFQCVFDGTGDVLSLPKGCEYLATEGETIRLRSACPDLSAESLRPARRNSVDVSLIADPHPETGEIAQWYLPDGRPVYRQALIKRWEARGRLAIPLGRARQVVNLPTWLAQGDMPIPPRMKWGNWPKALPGTPRAGGPTGRLDLTDLAKVVDFLEG